MIEQLTERALRALCDQIGAGRVRRENLRDAFTGILADLAGVSKGSIETAMGFMPPVVLNALLGKVDALWSTCNKSGVKPPRQAIDEAITNTCGFFQAAVGEGNQVELATAQAYLVGALAVTAGIPRDQAATYFNDNATDEQWDRLEACISSAGGSAKGKSVVPWLIGLGVAAKLIL